LAEGRLEFILKGKQLKAVSCRKNVGEDQGMLLIKKRDSFAQMAYVTETMLNPELKKRLKIKSARTAS